MVMIIVYFRNVLELGSGIGLMGLVIQKISQPHHYIFSDCHQDVLNLLQENVNLNSCHSSTQMTTGDSGHIHHKNQVNLDSTCFPSACVISKQSPGMNEQNLELNSTDAEKTAKLNEDVAITDIKRLSSCVCGSGVSVLELDWQTVTSEDLQELRKKVDVIVAAGESWIFQ